MSKWCSDTYIDQSLNYLVNNVTQMCICSSQPASLADATTNYNLSTIPMTSTSFTGPAPATTPATGDTLSINQQTGTVTSTGTASYIALCSATALLYVTTCASQVVTAGNQLVINSWTINIAQPT